MQARDAQALADFADQLSAQQTAADAITTVTEAATAGVDADCGSAMVLESRPSRIESTATTSPAAARADQLQLDHDAGPSLEAARMIGDRWVIDDTRTDQRWPVWSRQACGELGIRSVLSVPLSTTRHRIGALNLYADDPQHFTPQRATIAGILAQHAAIAVDSVRRRDDLQRAVESRTVIGQALGILMERYDLDEARAFATLRRYSQDSNVKLRDIAEQLIARRALPGLEPPTSR